MALGRLFTLAANFTDPHAYFVGGGVVEADPAFRDWFVGQVVAATTLRVEQQAVAEIALDPAPRHGRRARCRRGSARGGGPPVGRQPVTRGNEKREHPGESRYAATAAVVVAIVLYAVLPSTLVILGPRFLIPLLELALLVPLLVGNPRRMTRQNRVLRWISIGLILLIALANATSLVLLVDALVNGSSKDGTSLLLGAGAGLAHQRHRVRAGVLGARPRRPGGADPGAARTAAAGGLPVPAGRGPRRDRRGGGRVGRRVGLVAGLPRLLLRVGDELLGVQPDRHDAALAPGEDADGDRVGVGTDAVGHRHRPRGQPAEVTWMLTA